MEADVSPKFSSKEHKPKFITSSCQAKEKQKQALFSEILKVRLVLLKFFLELTNGSPLWAPPWALCSPLSRSNIWEDLQDHLSPCYM